MKSKHLWPVLILALVAVAIFITTRFAQTPVPSAPPSSSAPTATSSAAITPATPTTTPAIGASASVSTTEKWVTYTNPELGFSFEYPESWGGVKMITRDSTERAEIAFNNCEGPCPPSVYFKGVGWGKRIVRQRSTRW